MVQMSDVMEIKGSPVKLIGLLPIGVLLTALLAALAFHWMPAGPTAVTVGWFGLVFFGLCTAVCLWRLLTAGQTVVTITPSGIKDVRLAADVVPWNAWLPPVGIVRVRTRGSEGHPRRPRSISEFVVSLPCARRRNAQAIDLVGAPDRINCERVCNWNCIVNLGLPSRREEACRPRERSSSLYARIKAVQTDHAVQRTG